MIYFPLDGPFIVHLKCPVKEMPGQRNARSKKCPVKDLLKTAVSTWGFPNGLM